MVEQAAESWASSVPKRNQAFDVLRIGFALFVILSHTAEVTDGNNSRELLTRLFHNGMTLGSIGVDGFFLLSGYLILGSWLTNPNPGGYLQKRILRIVPGYLIAVIASVSILGMIAPATDGFFGHLLSAKFIESVLILGSPVTPPLFPGLHWNILNGSLWTITYEFCCYLIVLLLGICGLAHRRYFWLAVTFIFFVLNASPTLGRHLSWHEHAILRLGAMFLMGGCYWHFKKLVVFRTSVALLALGFLMPCFFSHTLVEPTFAVFGGYLIFFAGSRNATLSVRLGHFPDISYGLYLYGWPVICLVVWLFHPSLWLAVVTSSTLSACLGWLSWHYVERPMLKRKRAPSAQLATS
jgi:peptidoglycan/LPS O-acetylase OafA/YrhL